VVQEHKEDRETDTSKVWERERDAFDRWCLSKNVNKDYVRLELIEEF